jgi:transcriptional regulator with XRE-family HTH domain
MQTSDASQLFAKWLQTQLAVTGLSRRQLAHQSGVNHSTISRLALGQRMPSLDTATRLARVLPELRHGFDTPTALRGVSTRNPGAPARLEYALRSDELLREEDVRRIMTLYLSARATRQRDAVRAEHRLAVAQG